MSDGSANVEDSLRTPTLGRWRLVLGREAEKQNITCGGIGEYEKLADVLGFLFREEGASGQLDAGLGGESGAGSNSSSQMGGSERSRLTVPDWIDKVNELFPNQAKEVLQKELVQRRGIRELLEKPELLERIEPNLELVKTLLTHRDLLNPETRILARKIIDSVVQQLKDKMKLQVETAITGALRRDRHSPRRVYRNLDIKTTVRRNLKNFDKDSGKLFVDQVYFYAAERKQKPWHIIVTVDQSGSMLESAIFSAVMASIFAELPSLRTSLVLFDTQVVDLSDKVGQPVDVLLSIHLGGGTDITGALQYSAQLVSQPARTICLLITDFYEGRDERDLIKQVRMMFDSGIRMIGLGALGFDARPSYNKVTAGKLRKSGMDILVCTPEKLAQCMAEIIRG